jgi:Carboxypeptidase regulatory-like domain/TonB dependent receptor-like, beta-barrel
MKHKFLFILVVCALLSPLALAQRDTGEVAGTITDPSGAVVQNAHVTMHNTATGFERTTNTSGSGAYAISALPPGNYDLTVTMSGFAQYKQPVVVTVGSRLTADVKLSVSAAAQTVMVEAAAAGVEVNTQDSQISAVVDPHAMMALPSLTRNPYDFVSLTGNLGTDPNGSTGGRGVGFSMNGQRSASTDITLDGAENVDTFTASVGQNIPLDSVQEYRVLTSGFDANYGRASGGMVNLETKSGTNNFHGSLYEYNRTSTFASNTYYEDATDAFDRANGIAVPPHDQFVRNQFGYSVGGPIIKDKLFFFSNTEWTRIRSNGVITDVIPTAAFLASSAAPTRTFFSSFGTLRSSAVLGAPIIPAPTTSNPAGWVGNATCGPTCAPLQFVTYLGPTNDGAGDPQNTYSSVERVDFNISNKTTLSGRYAVEKDNLFPGVISTSPYAGYDTGETDLNQNILLTVTHNFTSNFLSSTKLSYNRLNDLQPLSATGAHPTLYLNQANVASTDQSGLPIVFPGYLPETPGSGIPFGGPQNQYQIYEDLTWIHGRHNVQFGGGFIQIRDNRAFGAYENAVEVVASNGTDESLALETMQAGTSYQFLGAVYPQGKLPCVRDYSTGALITTPSCTVNLPVGPPKFERANRYNDGNFYLQDTWKVTPRLTFTPGLRWEYYGVQHSNPALDSNYYLPTAALTPQNFAAGSVQLASQSSVGGLWEKHPHDFAPRLGLAWDPKGDGKTAVRAGYGVAFERNFGNVTYNVIQNPPNYAVLDIVQPGTAITTSPAGPLAGTGTKALPPVSLRAPLQSMPTSYSQFYNASVEHQVMQGTLLSLEYSGSRGEKLYSIYNMNLNGYGETVLGLPPTAYNEPVGQVLNPQYGAINQRGANGDSYYNALNVRFQVNRFSAQGLQLSANYTYAHSIDNLSSTFSESFNNFNLGYLNPWDPGESRGNSDFDIRHRLVVGGVYAPKYLEFSNHSHLFQTLLGSWEFAPIFTVRTGSPFTLYDCTNAFFLCPDVVPAAGLSRTGHAVPNGGVDSFNYLFIPSAAANPYVDPILGRSDLPTCSGNRCTIPVGLARNSWFSPGYWNWDQGIYKNFKFHERYTFQLRGEFYNITNHKNMYIVPGNADIAELSGYVLGIKGSPGANGGPGPLDERRNMQLALRFQF